MGTVAQISLMHENKVIEWSVALIENENEVLLDFIVDIDGNSQKVRISQDIKDGSITIEGVPISGEVQGVSLDPLQACLLSCGAGGMIDIVNKCRNSKSKHPNSKSKLSDCLRSKGYDILSDVVKCALRCGIGSLSSGGQPGSGP